MASYRPTNGRGNGKRMKPWLARRRRDGVEYVMGFFTTKEEALEAERGFDSVWPGNRGHLKGKRRHVRTDGKLYYA